MLKPIIIKYMYNRVYLNCPVNILQITQFAPTGNRMLAIKQTKRPMEHSSNILNETNLASSNSSLLEKKI